MKKLLLIIALLISVLGLNAQSVTIGDLEFTVTSETPAECEVSDSGEPTDVTIPSTVTISGKEYSVTSIGSYAFYGRESLTSIDFGENSQLTSIGVQAFYECSSLTSIEIPSGVTSIGYSAFSGCSSLTSIEIPSGVTSIENGTFEGCSSLTSIEIPSGVTSIGYWAFYYCSSLTSIEIPSGVTSIGERAFYKCSSLTSIEIPSGVTSIGNYAFDGCSKLTSIEIPSGVTYIGNGAFLGCSSLTSIELPSGVTSIGSSAFSGCSSLTSIELPSGVTSIGNTAFSGCSSLTSIEIPSGVTSIGSSAFWGCSSLTSIELPSGVTSIGNYAFSKCSSLTSIEIPSGVASIGILAFDNCTSLTSIEIPSGVTSIGNGAFNGCSSLTSIDFGENSQLTSIGGSAFYECSSLTSIEIPSGVTFIGGSAFSFCSSLTSIEIPSSVTSIVNTAFSVCSSLTGIVVESGNTVYDSRDNCNAIIETATNTLIAGCQSTVIPNTVTSIGDYAFSYCYSLTSIEIPSGVTSIGDYAFCDCSSLTSIEFEENSQLTSIGDWAFPVCSSLTSIEIPSGVTFIGERAFSDCDNLTSIYCYAESVPETYGDAYYNSFYNCPSDMVIYVPEQSVGAYKAASPWNEYTILAMPNYEIAVVIAPSESGVVTGAGTYNHGEEVTLTATANEGYKFVSWTENGEVVSEEAEYSFEITKDRNLVANFELLSYNVTASVNPENVGVVTDAGTYNHGEEVTLTATANEGYKFVNWTENGEVVSEEAEYSFEITKDRNLVANFELLSYNVTASVNPENAGVVNGAGTYNHGEDVTLTATANEGYKFINWTENGEVVSEEAEYSFEITKDRNLVANFELLSYNVTASVNPENAGVVTGAGTYNHGEDVTLTATANEGYKFVNWTENGEVVSEEAKYLFEITKDRNLVANFELLTYEVVASVNIENAGEITGAGSYEENDTVTLTAKANEGYKFINWTENGEVVSEEAEYSFEITEDRNLVANFEEIEDPENPGGNEPGEGDDNEDPENPGGNEPGDGEITCIVTAVANPEEGGSVSGAGTYKKDMTVTLKATAKSGYQFLNWTENDVIVSTESEYTFTITKDINLVANFEKTTCNVTVVVNPEEAGTVTGAGTYVKNVSVTLVATANPGYKFVNWTENGTIVSTEREYSFVVSLDTDLVANFISTEGVEELASSFNIYPNPVSDKLYIETQTQTQTVEIYDVYGRQQSMVNGQQSTVIDVSDLNSGVYFVKVVTSEGEAVKRFIKD